MEKRRNFSSFPHYFIVYKFLTSGVKLHIHLLNVVVQFIVLLTLLTLICRGTDISKCFSESLGIRDNESRLYVTIAHWPSTSSFGPKTISTCIAQCGLSLASTDAFRICINIWINKLYFYYSCPIYLFLPYKGLNVGTARPEQRM